MAMLSYKQYILMQENFGGVLGVSAPTKLGLQNEAPQLFGMMSKKMAGDAPDMGMGGNKPEMGMGKPKPKPDMGSGPDDDMDDDGDDMGDDDDDDLDGGDMDNSDDDGDDMGDDDGDEGGGDDMGDDADGGMMGPGGSMGGPGGPGGPPMGKKKPPMAMGDMGGPPMMKKMTGAMHMRKESSDPEDAKMNSQNKKNKANDQSIDKAGTAQKKTGFVKGGKCCSKMSKKCCKMTKEQTEFNNSLRNQLGITGSGELKFTRDELGFWVPVTEDVLVNNPGQEDNEPQPGDVGYAPQQKLGMTGSNFQEWATYHKKQVKKNKKR